MLYFLKTVLRTESEKSQNLLLEEKKPGLCLVLYFSIAHVPEFSSPENFQDVLSCLQQI